MNPIKIQTSHTSDSQILIGESLKQLKTYLPNRQVVLVVDENVNRLYADDLSGYPCLTVDSSEANKTLATVERLAVELLNLGADRSTYLVGIGGGITCDITGFLASIFMRGVGFGLVSTTLLSQLDASVGGKNGVNLHGYKNMLGVFNQPDFVICDVGMLSTLPEREFRGGLSELIKAALITDAPLFHRIIQSKEQILSKDTAVLTDLIHRGVEIKADIVRRDERESGERKKLNLGHTFAHAIEASGELNHGEAVSVGMVIAAGISHKLGLLTKDELAEVEGVLQLFGLPVTTAIPKTKLLTDIRKDKKKQGDSISFVLMNGIGSCELRKITFEELGDLL